MAGSKIDDRGRDKEGGDAARPALHQLDVLALDDIKPAHAGRNVDAHFIQVRVFRFPAGHGYSKVCAGQGHLDEAAHFFQFFFLNPLEGIEVLDLSGDLAIEVRGIEMRNRPDAALPGDEVLPAFLRADAQRADQSNARNDYPASQVLDAPC